MTHQERKTLDRLARRANAASRRIGIAIGNRSFDPSGRDPAPGQTMGAAWCVLFRLFISGLTDDRGRRLYPPPRPHRPRRLTTPAA